MATFIRSIHIRSTQVPTVAQWTLVLVLILFAPSTWSAACDAVFTNGVQSHSSTGSVNLEYQTQISGGDNVLSTPVLSVEQQVTCGGATCTASGSAAASSVPDFVTGSGGDGDVSSNGNLNVDPGDYRSVEVNQQRRLRFSVAGGQYLMESLTTNYQSELELSSGDYWIDGDLVIGQETDISPRDGGTVRLFVDGNVALGYQVETSGFSAENLLIYATGNITFANEVQLDAFLYSGGTLSTGFQSQVTGGLSGAQVNLENENDISYDAAALAAADFTPFCSDAVAQPQNLVAYWAMDEASWSGASGEVIDQSGNGNNATARNGANTASDSPALLGDPGTCGYGQFDGGNDYLEVPGLSDTLNDTASLAFWVKTTQTGDNTGWVAPGVAGTEQSGGTNDIFWGWLDASGRIGVSVGNDYSTKSQTAINSGQWRHVVLIRDVEQAEYRIYIDGALDASGAISAATVTTAYNSIGRIEDTGGTPEYFSGELDEVRIYGSALSDEDVSAIYGATHPCGGFICSAGTALPGLLGNYYDTQNLDTVRDQSPTATRVDGPIEFTWNGNDGPSVLGQGNDFSILWSGRLLVTESGNYQFTVVSDDGVRLLLDGQTVIDEWYDHDDQAFDSGRLSLEAGQVYDIQLEYYENQGDADIELYWSRRGGGPRMDQQLIPSGNSQGTAAGLYHCPGNAVAAYTLEHSNTGVTCEALPVTITARDSAGNPIEPSAGTVIDLMADPSPDSGDTGWFEGSSYTFSGAESSVLKYLNQPSPASVDLAVTDGIATGSSGPVSFANTGLVFYGDRTGGPLANQVAGAEDPNPVIRAVRTDDETGACTARVANQNRNVGFGYECVNPGTCNAGQTLTLAGAAIQTNNLGAGPAYAGVNLAFDADGYAAIPLEYSDVGDIRLWAQLSLPVEGEQPAVDLLGQSNRFISKPHTLVITDVFSPAGQSNPGDTGSGAGFVASGEPFSVRVQARNARGSLTPNFGNESPTQSVRLELEELRYPVGGSLGALGSADSFARDGGGVALNDSLTWDNVGTITLTPRLIGDDYLGAGDLVAITESDPIGRFYPFDYALGGSATADACGSFSYLHQADVDLSYTLNARNLAGAIVSNYDDTGLTYVGTASPGYVAEDSDAGNGGDLSGRVQVVNGAGWVGGVLNVNDPGAAFLRASNTQPDGPWESLQWGLILNDSLDSRPLVGLDMNANTSGDCAAASNCNAVALGDTLNLRFGRLRLQDAFGPEVIDLPVPFYTEYWTGSEFVRNVDDSCTRIPRDAITYQPTGDLVDDNNRTVPIGSGDTTGQYANLDGVGVNFSSSDADHYFTAPGAGNTGSFDIEIDLTNRPWLRFDWNQDGDYLNDVSMPPANIGFGSYRGHDRIIYWREILE